MSIDMILYETNIISIVTFLEYNAASETFATRRLFLKNFEFNLYTNDYDFSWFNAVTNHLLQFEFSVFHKLYVSKHYSIILKCTWKYFENFGTPFAVK